MGILQRVGTAPALEAGQAGRMRRKSQDDPKLEEKMDPENRLSEDEVGNGSQVRWGAILLSTSIGNTYFRKTPTFVKRRQLGWPSSLGKKLETVTRHLVGGWRELRRESAYWRGA